jgi:hypothetical protein
MLAQCQSAYRSDRHSQKASRIGQYRVRGSTARAMKGAQRSAVEAWLASLYAPDDVPSDDDLNGPTLRWLRRYHSTNGPDSRDVVADALLAYQLALAEEAAAAALHDLEIATDLRPRVAVEDHDGLGVRIWINGGYTAPSMLALDKPEAFAELADYFQGQLDQSGAGAWPVCDRHDLGLHAEVHDGVAVWWCRKFQHAVAPVGHFGEVGRARRRDKRR